MSFDIDAADAAIDRLFESRAAEKRDANHFAESWRASQERYIFGRGEERRIAWLDYHRRQASVFESLAEEHRQRAGELIDLPAERTLKRSWGHG